jgi:hypothetical protein
MEQLGKPRHGREGRRLNEREVSESNPVAKNIANFTGCLDFARHDALFWESCQAIRRFGFAPQRVCG